MDNEEIAALKAALKLSAVWWVSDFSRPPMRVKRIGAPPPVEDGDEPEPSECAYFTDGTYAALWNAELSQFTMSAPIPLDTPKAADHQDLLHLSFERFWQSRRSSKPGDLHKLPIDRRTGDGGDGIEYSQDHVQRHWWTFQNAVRLHGEPDAALYQWLRGQNWTLGTLSVVETSSLKPGHLTFSGARLDEVIKDCMATEATAS